MRIISNDSEPEKILGASEFFDWIVLNRFAKPYSFFFVSRKNNTFNMAPAFIANTKFPQQGIQFYQERIQELPKPVFTSQSMVIHPKQLNYMF